MLEKNFAQKWKQYKLGLASLEKWTRKVSQVLLLLEAWEKNFTSQAHFIEKNLELQKQEKDAQWQIQACALFSLACKKKMGQSFSLLGQESVWSVSLYPEQIMACLALLENNVVEQATGEGKTFSVMAAAYIHSLEHKQVHVITANPYLAARDAQMSQFILNFFHIPCACNHSSLSWKEKQALYKNNRIIFGTVQDFGFDYLRNRFLAFPGETLEFVSSCALLDEIDSVLLEEASLPLILSQNFHYDFDTKPIVDLVAKFIQAQNQIIEFLLQKLKNNLLRTTLVCEEKILYLLFAIQSGFPRHSCLCEIFHQHPFLAQMYWKKLPTLQAKFFSEIERDLFYTADEAKNVVCLTDKGWDWIEQEIGCDPFSEKQNFYTENNFVFWFDKILTAHVLLEKDLHYLVDREVLLLDSFTGRPQIGKKLRFGLHDAVQAKENLSTNMGEITCARISIQNYIRLYSFFSGTCGVAFPAREEWQEVYNMPVIPIPLHCPENRKDFPAICCSTWQNKIAQICHFVQKAHRVGRPILIGTRDIPSSEWVAQALKKKGLEVALLHGKNLNQEHEILCNAGAPYHITVATNVAGRGADIVVSPSTLETVAQNYIAFFAQDTTHFVTYSKKELEILQKYLTLAGKVFFCSTTQEGYEIHVECQNQKTNAECQKTNAEYQKTNTSTKVEVILGLETIVAEFMEEERIEIQFRRRCGRQGIPGVSRALVSLEDRVCASVLKTVPGIFFSPQDVLAWQKKISRKNQDHRRTLSKLECMYDLFQNYLYNLRANILNEMSQNKPQFLTTKLVPTDLKKKNRASMLHLVPKTNNIAKHTTPCEIFFPTSVWKDWEKQISEQEALWRKNWPRMPFLQAFREFHEFLDDFLDNIALSIFNSL